jgi:hypothetical protein
VRYSTATSGASPRWQEKAHLDTYLSLMKKRFRHRLVTPSTSGGYAALRLPKMDAAALPAKTRSSTGLPEGRRDARRGPPGRTGNTGGLEVPDTAKL